MPSLNSPSLSEPGLCYVLYDLCPTWGISILEEQKIQTHVVLKYRGTVSRIPGWWENTERDPQGLGNSGIEISKKTVAVVALLAL